MLDGAGHILGGGNLGDGDGLGDGGDGVSVVGRVVEMGLGIESVVIMVAIIVGVDIVVGVVVVGVGLGVRLGLRLGIPLVEVVVVVEAPVGGEAIVAPVGGEAVVAVVEAGVAVVVGVEVVRVGLSVAIGLGGGICHSQQGEENQRLHDGVWIRVGVEVAARQKLSGEAPGGWPFI